MNDNSWISIKIIILFLFPICHVLEIEGIEDLMDTLIMVIPIPYWLLVTLSVFADDNTYRIEHKLGGPTH